MHDIISVPPQPRGRLPTIYVSLFYHPVLPVYASSHLLTQELALLDVSGRKKIAYLVNTIW